MDSISSPPPTEAESPVISRSSSILLSSSNNINSGGAQIHLENNNNNSSSSSSEEGKNLRLKWEAYPQSLVDSFRSLREEDDFVDVTLACKSRQFTAHKVVLSACSPYFRRLLKSNPCQHPIIILRDVLEIDIESLLSFMYNGEVSLSEDRIKDFLKTAESLQIRGLADQLSKDIIRPMATSLVIGSSRESDSLMERDDYSPIPKRHRLNGDTINNGSEEAADNNNTTTSHSAKESLLSQALEKPPLHNNNNNAANTDHEDSASDDGVSETHEEDEEEESMMEEDGKASHHHHPSSSHPLGGSNVLFPPGLEALYRQAGFPPAFLGGLGAAVSQCSSSGGMVSPHSIVNSENSNPISSSSPSINTSAPPLQSGGLQSHSANPTIGGKLEMMRVRATDPRPCPKCGKIYRSAHTLRTHMEDKHTICPGYRCVLCGTVAKSRNSLHSHMSRQHRGISTKDLPVVPMPAPFDAGLASRLFQKAGVKVTPSELAARASPTAPRRSDLPKLDSNFLNLQQAHQFPLPPSMPRSGGSEGDAEDLRIPYARQHLSFPPKELSQGHGSGIPPPGMGSSLLDTYLSMIAAAGEGNMAAAAFNFHHMPPAGRAALVAAAAGGGLSANGADKDPGSDREGELGSDADNEDLSDSEEHTSMSSNQQQQQQSGGLKEGGTPMLEAGQSAAP